MKRTSGRRPPRAQTARLPLMLHVLALHIDPEREHVSPEAARALTEARRLLRMNNDHAARADARDRYLDRRARAYDPNTFAALERADIVGAVHNGYTGPAMYLGIALAYLLLTNDGGAE